MPESNHQIHWTIRAHAGSCFAWPTWVVSQNATAAPASSRARASEASLRMRLSAPMTVDSRLCSRLHPATSSSLPAWYARMWSCARDAARDCLPASMLKAYACTTQSVHAWLVF